MTHSTADLATASIASYPDLAGKVAVITASSQGIGAASALALALNGVRVVVNGRDPDAVSATTAHIRKAGGEATGISGDALDAQVLTRLSVVAERSYGPVDIFGAFVGGSAAPPGPTADISLEDWNATVRTNLTAAFLGLKAFLPGMIERRRGSIITLSSAAARLASGGRIGAPTAYAAAKAGLVRLTQEAAKEAGPHGVRVNCIAPSTILTERLGRVIPPDRKAQMTSMHPLGRLGVPADVANAVLFLASDSASWITGATLDVTGGQVMV
jgi:3-oxoacyl-[acyl-carrier protein] reductase